MAERLMGDITIRKFDVERDADHILRIAGEIWEGGDDALMEKQFGVIGGKPWSAWIGRSVLNYLKADGARSFVVEENGEMIGFCSYLIDQARSRGTVGYNGVQLKDQGRGIGSAMLDYVMAAIRTEGVEYAAVIVADNEQHAAARRNYQKHGFRELMGFHYLIQKLTPPTG